MGKSNVGMGNPIVIQIEKVGIQSSIKREGIIETY
jgi:hypothetical protein